MKNAIKLLILIPISFCFIACGSLGPIQNVPQEITHEVTIPAHSEEKQIVDDAGKTQTVKVEVPEQKASKTEVIQIATVNPQWTSTIKTLQAVNSLADPTPFSPLVNLALGGIMSVLAGIAAVKNHKANKLDAALGVVVEGVESLKDPKVKEAIKAVAVARGIYDSTDKTIQAKV